MSNDDKTYQLRNTQQVRIVEENETHYLIEVINTTRKSTNKPWWITKVIFRNKYEEVHNDK